MSPPMDVVPDADPTPTNWDSPTKGTELPYDFVPVLHERMTAEAPIWHDGSHADPDSLYSGELRCTLTTLTPTIVGNQQVAFGEVDNQLQIEIDAYRPDINNAGEIATERQRRLNRPNANARKIDKDMADELQAIQNARNAKKLLLPLRATFLPDGPVLIPGESIAGMLRHSLGALLNAPMERVQPGSFSYRPNVLIPNGAPSSRPMAAEVIRVDLDMLTLELKLCNLQGLLFVHGDDSTLFTGLTLPATLPAGFAQANWARRIGRGRECIEPDPAGALKLAAAHRALRYQFGTAGRSGFVRNGPNPSPGPHPSVVVPQANFRPRSLIVEPAVVHQYRETLHHLGDGEHGHLARARGVLPNNWNLASHVRALQPGDVVFCEVVTVRGNDRVISFGHNFRYRWRQLNGVTDLVTHFDAGNGRWTTTRRPELSPHADERAGANGRPEKLTAVRNMFGYVVDARNKALRDAQPSLADPFDRMAGRLSFNFALERVKGGETDEDRFDGWPEPWLFLHPTVEPKPQFDRSYVPGAGCGWGGGLLVDGGKVHVQGWTPNFAGRKFFLHQGSYDATTGLVTLPPEHYDLRDLMANPGKTAHTRWDLLRFVWSDQAQIARHVSAPGRQFGFTLRFKSLRGHELAAVAAVLSPDLLAQAIHERRSDGSSRVVRRMKRHVGTDAEAYAFANKLGHGRALGLGSVRIEIDSALRWPSKAGDSVQAIDREQLKTLIWTELLEVPRLDLDILYHWLRVLKLNPERTAKPYLLKHDEKTMIKWSAAQRKEQLEASRENPFPAVAAVQPPHGQANAAPNHGGGAAGGVHRHANQRGPGHGGNRRR